MAARAWLIAGLCCVVLGGTFALLTSGAAPGWFPPAEPWHWDKPARVDGARITVTFEAGTCDANRWVEVQETPTRVRLTAMTREKGGDCAGLGTQATETVTLDKPLGDRELIDGACAEWQGGPTGGNCGDRVRSGECGGASYAVDQRVSSGGEVRLRARITGANPGAAWTFRWQQEDYDEDYRSETAATVDAGGAIEVSKKLGDYPGDRLFLRQVEIIPPVGEPCTAKGRWPMWWGFAELPVDPARP